MSSNIVRLINTFGEYYNRKHNYKEATTLLKSLCDACDVSPDFPKYQSIKNIDTWYNEVYKWLVKEKILQ